MIKTSYFLRDNIPVIKRNSAILGNCIPLYSASARLSSPGSKNQNGHIDGACGRDLMGLPMGIFLGQINVGII
jgi:hypothetical protein